MGKLPTKLIIGILLAIFIGIASYIRIYLPYNYIFVGDWIKFSGNDAYYYMRIVDNLAHNFPHLNGFDPYFIYPGGSALGSILFFAWLMAGVIWVIGLGAPAQHLVDVVGAYFPVVLAALTIIPVYFIGKQLFNRWAGVIAAALIAIVPGEFLGRSILAYTDHHIAETLFSTTAMLFLILAIKTAGQSQLTFNQLKQRDWSASTRALVYCLLAGISLGVYLLTWIGGLLFVFIISVYLIIQSIIDHLRHKSTDYLCIIGFTTLLIATIMFAPFSPGGFYLPAMLMALLVPPALSAISRLMAAKHLKSWYYPLALIGVGVVGLGIFYAAAPALLRTMLEQFGIFAPTGPGTTTLEVPPLFSQGVVLPIGNFPGLSTIIAGMPQIYVSTFVIIDVLFIFVSFVGLLYFIVSNRESWHLHVLWSLLAVVGMLFFLRLSNVFVFLAIIIIFAAFLIYATIRRGWSEIDFYAVWSGIILVAILSLSGSSGFDSSWTVKNIAVFITSQFFFSVVSLGIFIYLAIKQGSPEKTLLVVWSLIILAATIGQRRFAYYFAANVALLISYLSWQIIWRAGLKKLAAEPANVTEKWGEKRARSKPKKKAGPRLTTYHVNTALAAIVIFFFVILPNIPTAAAVARGARFAPSDAWMSAMDWMRTNTPDPFGNPDYYYQLYPTPPAGKSYTYPKSAYGVTSWWDYGYWVSRIAHRLPSTNPSQGAEPIINVTHLFLSQDEASSEPVMQSLDSRYIVIDNLTTISKFWAIVTWAGKPQTEFVENYYLPPQKAFVSVYYPEYYRSTAVRLYNFDGKAVTPQTVVVISWDGSGGRPYKQITNAQSFSSYKEATTYIESQKSANYRIVGTNPFISPVPLEALNDYKLVYSSNMTVTQAEVGAIPEVKIFEYTGKANP